MVLVLLIVFGYRYWGLLGTGVALSLSYVFDLLLVGGYAYPALPLYILHQKTSLWSSLTTKFKNRFRRHA